MLHYLLQTIAFQLLFLLIYDLSLKKETFFNWNRGYLLTASMLSFILPFIKISALQNTIPQAFVINLPEVVVTENTGETVHSVLLDTIYIAESSVSYMQWVFYFGFGVSGLLFVSKLLKIGKLIYNNPKVNIDGFRLVNLGKSRAAFSFLNYIFIGEKIDQNKAAQILAHEKIHVAQRHSFDLLYFEILRILFWFNPLIYIFQNRIGELHEFIADSKVVKHEDKSLYYQNLLSQIFDTNNVSFINTFFKQSLIKKRIVMLSKQKSKEILKLKYALIIPVVFSMLLYTSCSQTAETEPVIDIEVVEEVVEGSKSPLMSKIGAMKKQMEIQGHASNHENKGFDLLLRVLKSDKNDTNLLNEVHAYETTKSKSILTSRIIDVFEQLQKQGDISDEEHSTLKTLMLLMSQDGFSDPFFQDVIEYAEIPYTVIEQVPVYPGCESKTNEEQRKCMSLSVSKFVVENFNKKVGKEHGLIGRQKIYVHFKIDNQGNVVNVKSRAQHEVLENEAKRVVQMLPKMTPGMQEGQAVTVPYALPIVFEIKE